MWVIWLFLIVFIISVILLIPYLLKEFRNILTYSPKVEDLGHFAFTEAEWEYLFQNEFVEDEKGRDLFDKYFNIISYENNLKENAGPEVYFSTQEIYLTDGVKGKSFTVNRLNYFQNGFKLNSIDLLHLSPLKKLRIQIDVIGADPESSSSDYSVEYLVPIPQSSLVQIDEIIKAYSKIILNR
jgi:hypothetical protein